VVSHVQRQIQPLSGHAAALLMVGAQVLHALAINCAGDSWQDLCINHTITPPEHRRTKEDSSDTAKLLPEGVASRS